MPIPPDATPKAPAAPAVPAAPGGPGNPGASGGRAVAPPPIHGFYFDGRSSRRHAVLVRVDVDAVSVSGEGLACSASWSACQLSERTRHGPRHIELGAGARIEIPEPAVFNAALAALGRRESAAVRMQQSWRITIMALVACVVAVAAAYQCLLPWAAGVVADRMPRAVLVTVSDQSINALDELVMKPSTLPAERQARLQQRLADISGKIGPAELLFRDGGRLGANALALPSGKIIVTDQLAAMLDDDQVAGVLAHELGHVVHRHGMRALLQNSVVALVAGWYLGDVSALLGGSAAAYANLRYSRDFEFEADAYATSLLRDKGMSPTVLASALEKLESDHIGRHARPAGEIGEPTADGRSGAGQNDADRNGYSGETSDYWSTHPATSDRIKRLLTREN